MSITHTAPHHSHRRTAHGRARHVIIGAGIHGLSTGLALAREMKARGLGDGSDVVVIDKSDVAGGRERHRLRRGAQQLLPARHARADGPLGGCLGGGRRVAALQPRGLHADQPRGDARGRGLDLRPAAGHRLRERVHRGRGGLGPPTCAACSTTGARAASRACCTRSAAATPSTPPAIRALAAMAQAEGVRIVTGHHGDGLRVRAQLRVGHRRRDEPGAASSATSSSSRPARGCATSGPCSTCRTVSPYAGATASPMTACPCGITGSWRRACSTCPPT